MATQLKRRTMKGVSFIVGDDDRKKAVVIDLGKHGALWEDFYDNWLSKQRQDEPREALKDVRRRVRGKR